MWGQGKPRPRRQTQRGVTLILTGSEERTGGAPRSTRPCVKVQKPKAQRPKSPAAQKPSGPKAQRPNSDPADPSESPAAYLHVLTLPNASAGFGRCPSSELAVRHWWCWCNKRRWAGPIRGSGCGVRVYRRRLVSYVATSMLPAESMLMAYVRASYLESLGASISQRWSRKRATGERAQRKRPRRALRRSLTIRALAAPPRPLCRRPSPRKATRPATSPRPWPRGYPGRHPGRHRQTHRPRPSPAARAHSRFRRRS